MTRQNRSASELYIRAETRREGEMTQMIQMKAKDTKVSKRSGCRQAGRPVVGRQEGTEVSRHDGQYVIKKGQGVD